MIVPHAGYHPINDGLEHINIYSKGRTELGRILSNFYEEEFDTVNGDGKFMSIEGYYHWLGLDENCPNKDILRTLSGYKAREIGKNLKRTFGTAKKYTLEEFHHIICNEVRRKFYRHQNLLVDDLSLWNAKFCHYIILNNGEIKDLTEQYQWFVDCITETRKEILDSVK